MKPTEREMTLIQLTAEKDSTALATLFRQYLPLVYSTYRVYRIRLFDDDDWLQEARIVCYETCCLYRVELGVSFGSFYKLRLRNHVHSLLRIELAQKRRADQQARTYEKLPDCCAIGEQVDAYYQSRTELECYLTTLSALELASFQILLGQTTPQCVCQQQDCSFEQVQRGMSRCQTKLRTFYRHNRQVTFT